MDQTSALVDQTHPSIQCCSGTGRALHLRHGFSTGDSSHHTPPPHPKNPYPKEGALVPVLSTLGCYPVNAGGVLGGERSFLCLPLLSVALTERVITEFRHHSPPPCLLFLPCLIHSANVCSSFKTRSTSPIPQELSSSSPSPQPKCPTFPFRTPQSSAAEQTWREHQTGIITAPGLGQWRASLPSVFIITILTTGLLQGEQTKLGTNSMCFKLHATVNLSQIFQVHAIYSNYPHVP